MTQGVDHTEISRQTRSFKEKPNGILQCSGITTRLLLVHHVLCKAGLEKIMIFLNKKKSAFLIKIGFFYLNQIFLKIVLKVLLEVINYNVLFLG